MTCIPALNHGLVLSVAHCAVVRPHLGRHMMAHPLLTLHRDPDMRRIAQRFLWHSKSKAIVYFVQDEWSAAASA